MGLRWLLSPPALLRPLHHERTLGRLPVERQVRLLTRLRDHLHLLLARLREHGDGDGNASDRRGSASIPELRGIGFIDRHERRRHPR